jgi:hypothetical protein
MKMEKLNLKTLSFPALQFGRVLATLGMVFAMVACGGGGGGGGAAVPVTPVYPNGCMACSGITSPVVLTTFNAQVADSTLSLTNIQVFGQNQGGSSYGFSGGPIALQGTMEVRQAIYDVYSGGYYGYNYNYGYSPTNTISQCVLTPGTYYIQTSSVGQMDGYGSIYPSAVIATSGSIELSIEGMLYQNNSRLYGMVRVLRVNGVSCSSSFYGVVN